jgi:hypothetical protein
MECCGNTIKDLYGFSCPLKCSTYILQSAKYYNAENNRARSLAGFQERLEVAILASNMEYCLEKFH